MRLQLRLASVIGLNRPHDHEDIGAVIQCISNQVFELARLVAATGKAGAVVPLDPDRRDLAIAAESLGESGICSNGVGSIASGSCRVVSFQQTLAHALSAAS